MCLRTRSGTVSLLTCSKPAPICTIQVLLGHAKLADTTVYLHLSRRHLQAVPSPLETIEVSSPDQVKRSRRLIKR